MQWRRGQFTLDDDRQRLDMERILGWLSESYWARARTAAEVQRSWDAAGIVIGLYDGNTLIGCARAVTDFTRMAYLSDVYVEPAYRGTGLGRWLVQTMIEHPDAPAVRWVLHTSDAHGLYRQLGFEAADETVMQKPRPDSARR